MFSNCDDAVDIIENVERKKRQVIDLTKDDNDNHNNLIIASQLESQFIKRIKTENNNNNTSTMFHNNISPARSLFLTTVSNMPPPSVDPTRYTNSTNNISIKAENPSNNLLQKGLFSSSMPPPTSCFSNNLTQSSQSMHIKNSLTNSNAANKMPIKMEKSSYLANQSFVSSMPPPKSTFSKLSSDYSQTTQTMSSQYLNNNRYDDLSQLSQPSQKSQPSAKNGNNNNQQSSHANLPLHTNNTLKQIKLEAAYSASLFTSSSIANNHFINSYNDNSSNIAIKKEPNSNSFSHNNSYHNITSNYKSDHKNANHTIFCIDSSGSMKKENRITECFNCVAELLNDNYEQNSQKYSDVKQYYTLLVFNTEAEILIHNKELDSSSPTFVLAHSSKVKPKNGTIYSVGFEKILSIIELNEQKSNRNNIKMEYVVVFLSDGRPGDWNKNDIKQIGNESETYKMNRQIFPSTTFRLHQLINLIPNRLQLFTIGIGTLAESCWLERLSVLADRSNKSKGTFILSTCIRDNNNQQDIPKNNKHKDNNIDNNTNKILNSNTVVSSINTITTNSLKESFRKISTDLITLTQSQSQSQSQTRLSERIVQLENEVKKVTQSKYSAVIMNYNINTRSFEASKDERIVILNDQAFARGGERNAYHLYEKILNDDTNEWSIDHYVAKESLLKEVFSDRLRFHIPFIETRNKAHSLAKIFNKLMFNNSNNNINNNNNQLLINLLSKYNRSSIPAITFIPCAVIRIRDEKSSGGFRYLSLERYLPNQFIKYNGNNGYIYKNHDHLPNMVAQAFTHWTYTYTCNNNNNNNNEICLVCDIQGNDYHYTDPTICSYDNNNSNGINLYGKSNISKSGIMKFFSTHVCNDLCNYLQINHIKYTN
eukprot:gene5456-7551_t